MRRAAAIVLVLLAARAAHAFPTGTQFDSDPSVQDGAGGIAFTGAPRWAGHTCAVCHTGGPGRISIELQADHPELFSDGWKPNMQYHLRVVMVGETAGVQYRASGDNCGGNVDPYRPCDQNGFAIELDNAAGVPVGALAPVANGACASGTAPPDVDARVLMDGTAATHTGAHQGLVAWDVCWTAPAGGAGTITAYIAAVDGNGGDGTEAFPTDVIGDDVASGAVALPELGGGEPDPQAGGCTAGGSEPGLAAAFVLLALLALVRRRRRRAGLAVLLALATVGGCVHVRPRQRETLAKRRMQFAPDRAEDELDLHMQESREGSSGGYGSSGGGCGCN